MQPHHDPAASADTKRPDPAPAEANSLPTQLSIPRAAMNAQIGQLRAHHPALRCRFMALSTPERSSAELRPASFSHAANRQEHGLFVNRSRLKRSMLRAVRVLSGISAKAERPFLRIVLALSGGTSRRSTAARTGRVRVLLERNPPNRPLVPAGTPALRRESNPAPQN